MDYLKVSDNTGAEEQLRSEEKLGFLKKVIGVVLYPGKAMRSIAAKPGILFPILLLAVSGFLYYLLNYQFFTDYFYIYNQELIANMGLEMTNEQLAAQADFTAKIAMYTTPVSMIIYWLIGTVILFAVVKILKGEGKFKQYLSVTGYAYVIGTLSMIVSTLIAMATGSFSIDTSLTGLAVLLPPESAGSFIHLFLNSFEVFSIWQYAVVAIGVLAVSKFSRTKAYATVFSLFLANALVMSAYTVASTSIASTLK